MRCWLLLLCGVLLVFTQAWTTELRAADPQAVEAPAATTGEADSLAYSPQWPEPPNTGAMLMRLGLGTVFVLVLCVGSLVLGKPWLQRLQGAKIGNQSMQIEGSVALGNRAMLYLVKVGDIQLVAGTDAAGLKSLIALPTSFKDVLEGQLPAEDAMPADTPVHFEPRLRAAVGS